MINERPGRVCVVNFSSMPKNGTGCESCNEHLALVVVSHSWRNLWMLRVDRFLMNKIGRSPREKRKCAVTDGFLCADKRDVV